MIWNLLGLVRGLSCNRTGNMESAWRALSGASRPSGKIRQAVRQCACESQSPGSRERYGLSDGHRSALPGAARVVVHSDVEVDIPAGSLEAQHRGLGILAGLRALFGCQQCGRKYLELEATIVELSDRVSDDHVRQ